MRSDQIIPSLRRPVLMGVCILGIAVVLVFHLIDKREREWQQLYVKKIRRLPEFEGLIYSKIGEAEIKGGIPIQTTMNALSIVLIVLWLLALCHINCSDI